MNPFQAAIDATFKTLGSAAVLEQDARREEVRVIPYEDDAFADFAETRVRDQGGAYEIRASEFLGFSKGAILEIYGERRRVQSWDVKDRLRLKKILRTVPA